MDNIPNVKEKDDWMLECRSCCRQYASSSSSSSSSNRDLPQPPKKPMTSFMLFYNLKAGQIRKEYPGLNLVGRSKKAGEMWKKLSIEEKEEYMSQYEARKEAYDKVYANFMLGLTDEEKQKLKDNAKLKRRLLSARREKIKRRKLLKDLQKPKKSLTPYFLFAQSSQIERGDAKLTEFSKGLAEQWKQLSLQDKQVFVNEAEKDKVRYEQEMSEWVRKMVLEGKTDAVTHSEVKHVLERLGQPKPAATGYVLFVRSFKAGGDKMTVQEISSLAATEWKNMKEKDRKKYLDAAVADLERYSSELEDWELKVGAEGLTDFVIAAQKLLEPKPRVLKPKKVKKKKKKPAKKATKRAKKATKKKEDEKKESKKKETTKATAKKVTESKKKEDSKETKKKKDVKETAKKTEAKKKKDVKETAKKTETKKKKDVKETEKKTETKKKTDIKAPGKDTKTTKEAKSTETTKTKKKNEKQEWIDD